MIKDLIDNKNIIIRNAEPKDAEEMILMVKQVMEESPFFPSTADEFNITVEQEEQYILSTALFLVAEIHGKMVGSASLDRSSKSKLNHTVTFGITILKEYSGMGLGSMIMKKIIEWCDLNHVEKIELEVFENNIPAIGLYKKFGFAEEGRRKKSIKTTEGYIDSIIMGKFLKD